MKGNWEINKSFVLFTIHFHLCHNYSSLRFAVTFNTLIVIHNITKQVADFFFRCWAYVTSLLPVAVAGVLAKLVLVISDYNTITVSIYIAIVNEGVFAIKQILTYFKFTSFHNCSSFTFLLFNHKKAIGNVQIRFCWSLLQS